MKFKKYWTGKKIQNSNLPKLINVGPTSIPESRVKDLTLI
jgi:hypothetical protein